MKVQRCATIDKIGRAVVITEKAPGAREPLSVCRRTLMADGRMCIDIQKRNAGSPKYHRMKAIFIREMDV